MQQSAVRKGKQLDSRCCAGYCITRRINRPTRTTISSGHASLTLSGAVVQWLGAVHIPRTLFPGEYAKPVKTLPCILQPLLDSKGINIEPTSILGAGEPASTTHQHIMGLICAGLSRSVQ